MKCAYLFTYGTTAIEGLLIAPDGEINGDETMAAKWSQRNELYPRD